MPRIRFAACVAALLAFALACGPASEEPPPEIADEDITDQIQDGPEVDKIVAAIERQRAELRKVPGREGILAEERLYSLFDEELIIRDFFQDRRDGFFLDVGCAWAVRANNTYYLEKHLGWRGIGIDALAEYAPEWHAKRPNSRFFSYLVTDESGIEETFYRSPLSPGLSSTHKDLASGKVFGADLEPEEVKISTITLDDLLDREGVQKIDLLAMDIEGHEPVALAGFDIDRFRPELVVVEGPILPEAVESDPVRAYLERHGYELIERYRPFDPVNRYFKRSGS